MAEQEMNFSEQDLLKMNEKEIKGSFFTPDNIYIEIELLKDIPIGCVFMEQVVMKNDQDGFIEIQSKINDFISDYQKRMFDSVDPYFDKIGYTDNDIEDLISRDIYHDYIFLMSPVTKFFNLLIRHILRNQNHSAPAEKYKKKMLDSDKYVREYDDVNFIINTYPLNLSPKALSKIGKEIGDSFGVNVRFINKNPESFDESDWDDWMDKIDCFYLHSFGRLLNSDFVRNKQHNMQFMGCYFFARKRFENRILQLNLSKEEFDSEIQLGTSRAGAFCNFEWLTNNDTRLTEEEIDFPMIEEQI